MNQLQSNLFKIIVCNLEKSMRSNLTKLQLMVVYQNIMLIDQDKLKLIHKQHNFIDKFIKLCYDDINEAKATNLDKAMSSDKVIESENSFVVSFVNHTNKHDFAKIFFLFNNVYKRYIVFDSFTVNSTDGYYFSWNFATNKNTVLGTVNSSYKMDNIISMRMYQPIFSSASAYDIYTYYNNLYLDPSSTIFTNRISILIQEMSSQSFIVSNNINYHWMFKIAYVNTLQQPFIGKPLFIDCQVDDNNHTYKFVKPITNINSFTFTFGSPNIPLYIKPSKYLCTFLYGNPTTIQLIGAIASQSSYYLTTTTVYFINFKTQNAADDLIIANINNPYGLTATFVDYQTLTIPIDTSSITPISNLHIDVFIQLYRFIFAIEFNCLKE